MKVYIQHSTLLLVTLWGVNCPGPAETTNNIWVNSGLVADLSLSDGYPDLELEVRYGNVDVRINMTLTPRQARAAPTTVRLKGAINCMPPFLLLMVDPDAPSRRDPKFRSWMHYLVLNANSTESLHEGEVAVDYAGPTPPKGSGPHRYVFLAYCQGAKRLEAKKLAPTDRPKFQLADFAKKAKLGRPFGGTFFFAENA